MLVHLFINDIAHLGYLLTIKYDGLKLSPPAKADLEMIKSVKRVKPTARQCWSGIQLSSPSKVMTFDGIAIMTIIIVSLITKEVRTVIMTFDLT